MRRLAGVLLGISTGYVVAMLMPTNEGLTLGLFTGVVIATW